jgi:hypothetical protein
MIIITNGHDNSMLVDNGDELDNPIEIKMSTVCTGAYTDFILSIPDGAEITYPRKATKRKPSRPMKIRILSTMGNKQ